jgi:hypothetical protein
MLGKALQAEQLGAYRRLQFAVSTFQLVAQRHRRQRYEPPYFRTLHGSIHLKQANQQQDRNEQRTDDAGEQKGAELERRSAQKKCTAVRALTLPQVGVQGIEVNVRFVFS